MYRMLALLFTAAAALAPVSLEAQAQAAPFVAARDLERGETLALEDLVLGEKSAAEAPVGWVTRRVVREGEPLRPPAIAPARVVHAGDQVQVVWSDGALELRMTGRAMNSAATGDPVRVRVDTRRRFEGTATGDGTVLLDPQVKDGNR